MPKRKRSKKPMFKRRRRFKKRYKRRAYPLLPISGFPKSKMVKLRYVQEVSLNAGAASVALNVFRANSCYDPDYTGVGGQCRAFDEWMNLYNHLTVVGSKIKVVNMGPGTSSSVAPGYWGIYMSDSGAYIGGGTTIEDIIENPRGGRYARCGSVEKGGRFLNTLTKTFSAKKFFGKKGIVGDSLYRHDAASNPTEGAFFELWHMNVKGNDPGGINFLVVIDYVCVLTERKQLSSS